MQIVKSFRAARLDGAAAPELLAPARLHDLFTATVAAHGDRLAVESDTERWTYAELATQAGRLARHLRAQGLGRGDAVALLLDRTPLAYVAILGVLQAGAAYVPLDPGFPRARIAAILEDSGAKLLLAKSDLDLGAPFPVPTIDLDKITHMLDVLDAGPLPPDPALDAGPRDLAYIIFTSGSTGRPKGVAIEHMSAVHYVRAASRLYAMQPQDRVYQGFTLAFDAAVEEVWCALANGAALLQAPAVVARSGPDLGPWLAERRATVLSTVPTLAALLDPDLPSLRLLILGGEACPPDVARRWLGMKGGLTPRRRVLNTYGPTEATVIVTAQEVALDRKLTIGTPLPNHSAYVLDDAARPLPRGAEGELWVGGPQLARGYLGIGADQSRFITNPDPDSQAPPRLYRTGDRVRVEGGEILFLGRVDDQVKVRGYRVELGEVENALADVEGVRAIAVSSQVQADGSIELVAHVVPAAGFETTMGQDLVAWARGKLPAYMVPAFVETVSDLPRLPSGKIDRKRLPAPTSPRVSSARPFAAPVNDRERIIAAAFAKRFGRDTVSVDDDFFQDLGGHSLLAAGVVSDLRSTADFAHLGVADLYTYPTVRALSAAIAAPPVEEPHAAPAPASRIALLRWTLFSAGQMIGVYALYLLVAAQYILPVATITYDPDSTFGELQFIVGLTLLSMSVYYPGLIAASVPLKWLIIGRIKPGDYDAYGLYAFRFWLVRRLLNMAPVRFLVHSPLLNTYYRLLGAKIGAGVVLGTDAIMAPDLLTIEAGTTIGKDAQMLGYEIVRGRLRIGPIRVGARSYVGTNSVLALDTVLGEDVLIADQSLVPRGSRLQTSSVWAGSPVQPASMVDPLLAAVRERALADGEQPRNGAYLRVFQAMWAFAIVLVPLAAAIPGFTLFLQAWNESLLLSLIVAPLAAAVFLGLLLALVTAIKRLLLPRLVPGLYRRTSSTYVRHWAAQRLIDLAMEFLRPFTGTLYFPWVLRLFGAKIGRGAECSSDAPLSIDLLTVGPDAFIADAATVGAPKRFGDWVGFAATSIGARAFIGNSALVRAGTEVGDDALLAVMSAPPPGVTRLEPGSAWLGCPALRLPGREILQGIDATRTYHPPRKLVLARYAIEFFRATLPFGLQIVTLFAIIAALNDLYEENDLWQLILLAPFAVAGYALVATAFVVAVKWIVVGAYKPKTVPLWSAWVWTSELVTGLYETIVVPLLLDIVLGTPIAPLVLRAFGTKIGRRVWLETSFITEFDLVEIGDEAEIGQDTDLQTHLFEDRVMKMGVVKIGPGCSVGRSATVLYDTEMEAGSRLGDLSLLMKGERLAAGTSWVGAPARRSAT
ncbi:MAG: lgrD 1 [Rhodospirillales bacterium]|nr:lgrD 1 [Rhodospirillales bacterium]